MKDDFNALTSFGKISIKNILIIALFAITLSSSTFANGLFFSQAMADDNATGNSTSSTLDNTSTVVTSNQNTISAGGQVTLVATVTDSSGSSVAPAGSIMWDDGSSGGSFSSSFCDLTAGTCTVSYASPVNAQSTITITATYSGDATHQTSAGTLPLGILSMHATSVAITPDSASFVPGTAITFTSTVSDTSNSPTTPSGTVSWSDGSAGGSFSYPTCTLSSGICTTSYTPSTGAPNSISITATYGGDSTHQTNYGTAQLSQGTIDTSSVLVTSSSSTISSGGQVTITATVTDASVSQNIPTGTITWSDGNTGGIFSSSSCNLQSGVCNITYTASSNIQGAITITASYGGDAIHTTNSGTVSLTSNGLSPTTSTISPNPASYVSGDTLTFTVTVADTSNSQNTPTGLVTWSDGNVGGVFGTSSCTLESGTCTTSYTPATNSPEDVTVTATYGGDTTHQTSAGTSDLIINTIHATTLSVTPNPATVSPGGSVTLTATVTDSSSSPSTPTSSVSWSDGNGGGTFDQSSCTLASGACTVSYTPSTNAPNTITITASYNGDDSHQASTGSSQLAANVVHPTTAAITPNQATFIGTPVTFTITVSDTTDPSSSMIGIVKWTDNGAGGTFSPDACIISDNHCSLDYTPPSNPSGSITIAASYAGDSTHSGSSATSTLSVNTIASPDTSQSSSSSESTTQSQPTTQPAPTTQPNTTPTTPQPTQPSTPPTQSNASPAQPTTQTNTSPSTTVQSTTQSNTHTTQTDSKNQNAQTTNTNVNTQSSPLTIISKAISSVVSELESIFQKL